MSKKFTKKRKDNEMTMKITTMMFNFAIQKILIMNFINKVSRKIKWISYIIEKDILEELEYKNLISHFTSQKTRKIDFKWNIL